MNDFKMGSLFDGSGTFPLASQMCGIRPVWASEIEPFPVSVTSARFPEMKHLGDVRFINGAEIEPVDLITFGSPCQDLSVAGKRGGLEGEKSGLFSEAIRIIKEMRCKTDADYPKFILWENVPGAFSSNGGKDFKTVLEEIIGIKAGSADVPMPKKWSDSGLVLGDGISVAWRVLDAQFWGVPQRRRRIFLVGDLRGGSAGEILFVREGLSGDFTPGGREEQRSPSCSEANFRESGESENLILNYRYADVSDVSPTLTAGMSHMGDTVSCVLSDRLNCLPNMIINSGKIPLRVYDNTCYTLTARMGTKGDCPVVISKSNKKTVFAQKSYALIKEESVCPTIKTGGFNYGGGSEAYVIENMQVRRLTPTECARLQGMPDWWCAGIPHKDSDEYKMWGNGVNYQNALYCIEGIKIELNKEREAL